MTPIHIVTVAAFAGVLAACGGQELTKGTTAPAAGKVVNVYNWPDYLAPGLLRQFEAETGIKVNYDSFDSMEMLETKLLIGNSGYDVVVPSAPFLQRQAALGVYQPIDRMQLKNYGNLDPELVAMLAVSDPGNTYGVGYMWGTTGIGFDARKVAAALPDAPSDSWRLVFDPAVASRLASRGIAFIDAPSEIIAVALMSLGKDPYSGDPADLAAAEARLMGIRPYVRYINTVPLLEDLVGGTLCVAVTWSGDALRARLRSEEAKRDSDIRYTIPIEGTLSWGDVLAIPKDAPHADTAHAFIDFLLRPDVGARLAETVRYATFNGAALGLLDTGITSDESIYPSPEVLARLRPAEARSLEQTRIENRIWTRFRTGH